LQDPFNRSYGFFYAFLGHHFVDKSTIGDANISDLKKDPLVTAQHSLYFIIAPLFGWILPTLIASTWGDALVGFPFSFFPQPSLLVILWSDCSQ